MIKVTIKKREITFKSNLEIIDGLDDMECSVETTFSKDIKIGDSIKIFEETLTIFAGKITYIKIKIENKMTIMEITGKFKREK